MGTKSESGRIAPRVFVADDSNRFIALDAQGKELLNKDLSLYLAAKPDVGAAELSALVDALAIACDQIICIISSDHPLFAHLKVGSFPVY